MGLPWVRLDTQFALNPKILELVNAKKWRAIVAYVASFGYAGGHGTAGYIPETALLYCHATKREAQELVEVGLWIPSPAGWDINGWDEKQVSDDAAKKRRERAQKGGIARADKARRAKLHGV